MQSEPAGLVFNIQRFSLHDGPGIRTTIFLKGCPLSCWWCHNPESQSFHPALMHYQDRCRRCGECVTFCPNHAVSLLDGQIHISDACPACGQCVDVCQAGAREIAGQSYTVSELMREIEKDTVFFDESGGGVTFSGGEPLGQPRFLVTALQACRKRGIHTVVETCGHSPAAEFAVAARQADMILYDLKFVDAEKHRTYTGRDNKRILDNLAALAQSGHPTMVRIPVIPGINDAPDDLRELARFLTGIGIRQVALLPYHQTGLSKYERLHIPYRLSDVVQPTPEHMNAIATGFKQQGFEARVGG